MGLTKLMACVACAVMLAACAPMETAAPVPVTPVATIAAAEAAFMAGREEQAFAMLQAVAVAHPRDKAPWIRMAQAHFAQGRYGEAIKDAAQAAKLDPDDKLAQTILAVSGLRVGSHALAELTGKNKVSGDVRTEARELARLMRAALGEEVLVPLGTRAPQPQARRRVTAPPARKPPGSNGPFANVN